LHNGFSSQLNGAVVLTDLDVLPTALGT